MPDWLELEPLLGRVELLPGPVELLLFLISLGVECCMSEPEPWKLLSSVPPRFAFREAHPTTASEATIEVNTISLFIL